MESAVEYANPYEKPIADDSQLPIYVINHCLDHRECIHIHTRLKRNPAEKTNTIDARYTRATHMFTPSHLTPAMSKTTMVSPPSKKP
jgi:hypothetical protein